MYTTMATTNTQLPFGQSYLDHLPDVLAIVEKANLAAAKALHHKRMKDVCYSIKAHYLWANFEQFFPASGSQYCWYCREPVSPEFAMSRHVGLCTVKERLADEAFNGPSAHESFYSYSCPYISRSSYSGPSWV